MSARKLISLVTEFLSDVFVNGILRVLAGGSSSYAKVGGVLYTSTTPTGNIGTGEDTLASVTIPANLLNTNNMSLWFEASGYTSASSAAKTLRVRFGPSGTNLVFQHSIPTLTLGSFQLRGRIFRTGAATQIANTSIVEDNAADTDISLSLNQTLSNALTLSVTGESTSNDDIICTSFIVGFDHNA